MSLIRTQCPDDIILPPGNPAPNASDVYADYLDILMTALHARGLDYEIAATVTDVDVELPVANLGLLPGCPSPLFDARLTDRDVTLKRADVETDFAVSGNFLANLPVPTTGRTDSIYSRIQHRRRNRGQARVSFREPPSRG